LDIHALVLPELGFGAEEAASQPLVADEFVDLVAFFRVTGLVEVDPVVLELREFFAGFADDELRIGIESGLEEGHRWFPFVEFGGRFTASSRLQSNWGTGGSLKWPEGKLVIMREKEIYGNVTEFFAANGLSPASSLSRCLH
jgi:hypothetical protein